MASSDVIELDSSDDEAQPVAKKVCRTKKKPTLNAMVHFPNEVPGLVIKPVKPALPNLQKVLAGGAVTITNVKKSKVTPQVYKAKPNGKSTQKFVHKPPLKVPLIRNRNTAITNPIAINNLSVNPLSLMKKQPNIRVLGTKLGLPPGITVKRATNQKILPNNYLSGRKDQSVKRKHASKIITTVELDDEEVPLTPGVSPQWYLRPEEQTLQLVQKEDEAENKQINDMEKDVNMELENNKEPDKRSYIEITIEDSPIKPLSIMRGFEVGSELPITIEDSPVKPAKLLKDQPSASDSNIEKYNKTEPQSKKKLDYPKDEEHTLNTGPQNVVEIDLELLPSASASKEKNAGNKHADVVDENKNNTGIQEIDIPKRVQTVLITKEVNNEELSNNINLGTLPQKNDSGEFHPIYQTFIDLCFELENSDDMVKIVEKKIKTYYRQCPKEYVESEEFTDMVSSKIFAMKAAPDKMYLYIKDIVDELNLQRKTVKAADVSNKENKKTENDKYLIAEDAEYDSKRYRQIRKLEKTIKKLHRAIQKLEEQEVEFEDEEDSVYLLTERYKERLIRVHTKFCQLTNTKMPSEPRIQIEARPGLPTGPAKRLEKWVNKKVPIGTPLPFPDFHDVLQCVRDANDEDRLGWNEGDIMEEARDLFTRCGKKLQRRRQENEWRIAASRLSHVSVLDPAEKNDDLKKKLDENKTFAAKKERDLLNRYADKQNQLKLVGEEIGDKEAEESPLESEDDEGHDESNLLEDKQKRKERLKRLLHEKTRKMSSEQENIIIEAQVNEEENDVAEQEEKMEGEAVIVEIEARKGDIHEVINEAEVKTNDTTANISGDGPNNCPKQDKTNESALYDVDSDIDELHLLQKLYFENEISSSSQESDSDTPIAISDTLDSDSDTENVKVLQNDDIISIENSSYSESEMTKEECERSKSEIVKDKRIDRLLLQNAEVMLISSTSSDKMDMDEENILLASSEEENDETTHLHISKVKVDTKVSNDFSAKNDCELIVDNSDENSLENNIKSYEVPLNDGITYETSQKIISNNFEGNILDVNKDNNKFIDLKKRQSNIQSENDVEADESSNSLVSIDLNQDLKVVDSKCNNAIAVEMTCSEANCTADKAVLESEGETSCEVDNYKCEQNFNPLNNQTHIDKVEMKVTASKEMNSEHIKDNSEIHELCQESVINDNNKSTLNSVNTICTEKHLNESEVTNCTVEIADDSSFTNEQNKREEVEVPTSVQCN